MRSHNLSHLNMWIHPRTRILIFNQALSVSHGRNLEQKELIVVLLELQMREPISTKPRKSHLMVLISHSEE